MQDMTAAQIKTVALVILVAAFFNIAGWWLFPRLMLLIIPITLVILACVGQYLKLPKE